MHHPWGCITAGHGVCTHQRLSASLCWACVVDGSNNSQQKDCKRCSKYLVMVQAFIHKIPDEHHLIDALSVLASASIAVRAYCCRLSETSTGMGALQNIWREADWSISYAVHQLDWLTWQAGLSAHLDNHEHPQ